MNPPRTGGLPQVLTALTTAAIAACTYALSIEGVGNRLTFVVLTLLLMSYLALEINRVRCEHPIRWMINPTVVCSLVTFVLGFGITNLLFFLQEDALYLIGVVPEVTPAMNKLMLCVVLGAVAMWLAYWSPLAARIAVARPALFPPNVGPRALAVPALIALSVAARIIQIRLGVLGYSGEYYRLVELGSYTQYLSMGAGLGKLALVIAALEYYEMGRATKRASWVYALLIYEAVFGFLSGFKSAAVTPFIIVAFCQYVRRGRFSFTSLVLIPVAMFVALAVVEPFRIARNTDVRFEGTSFTSIWSAFTDAVASAVTQVAADEELNIEAKPSFFLTYAGRSNLTAIGSLGISFADEQEALPEGSPEFLQDIFLAPLHAWVPRAFWQGKSLANSGLWYTQIVLGYEFFSSAAMGVFTYLYFAGGLAAVILGLGFLGVVQRTLFFTTEPWNSRPGAVVFLSTLTAVAVIAETPFNSILIAMFRDLPLTIILTKLLYRPMHAGAVIRPLVAGPAISSGIRGAGVSRLDSPEGISSGAGTPVQ